MALISTSVDFGSGEAAGTGMVLSTDGLVVRSTPTWWPGDSGGAVLDADGEVVAMTTAASSGTADITGYAVPIATVLSIIDTITAGEENGSVTNGYDAFLGVVLDPQATAGTTVAGVVEGSPAAVLGLTAGSTVTSVDGEPVANAEALRDAVACHDAGEQIKVTWTDATGDSRIGTATLTQAPVG